MKRKIRVGIIFGGKSAEHEVSLQSAKNVVEAIDKEKYEPVLIGVDKMGYWHHIDDVLFLSRKENPFVTKPDGAGTQRITRTPQSCGILTDLSNRQSANSVDVIFPILHGPFGEDGTIQGLLKLAGVPFVGAGVLGSAVSMDKDVMKRLLRNAGIPTPDFIAVKENETPTYEEVTNRFGSPFFVKPANIGSSVGVSKVRSKNDYTQALTSAFSYDTKILVEENIKGREIECAVLGNADPIASIPGEVVCSHDFYSYEAKYLDEHGATLIIPARLPKGKVKKIQALAIKTFKALECEGLGRVDFFLNESGELLVNEINTIPGFTSISMYPKLWETSGVSYTELIDRLIQLALERFEKEQKLKTSYRGKTGYENTNKPA